MRRHPGLRRGLKLFPWLMFFLASPLLAQPAPPPPDGRGGGRPGAQDIETTTFLRNFQRDVVRGCLSSQPSNLRNPRGYCSCYANALVRRFTPQDLAVITRASGEAPQNPKLIALMMAPEIRACRAANG